MPVLDRPSVVVVDDRENDRRQTILVVRDAGYSAVSIPPYQVDARTFLNQLLAAKPIAVVLDHRLSQSSPVPFSGAEMGALCYQHRLPAILRTTFGSAGDDMTLRRNRRWLPRVLARTTGGEEVAEALDYCRSELEGRIERQRQPQRSLLEVLDASNDGSEPVVDVLIPGWSTGEAVRFPAQQGFAQDPSPAELRHLIGRQFFALVNVWADREEDLFIDEVAAAEEPPEDFMPFLGPPPEGEG